MFAHCCLLVPGRLPGTQLTLNQCLLGDEPGGSKSPEIPPPTGAGPRADPSVVTRGGPPGQGGCGSHREAFFPLRCRLPSYLLTLTSKASCPQRHWACWRMGSLPRRRGRCQALWGRGGTGGASQASLLLQWRAMEWGGSSGGCRLLWPQLPALPPHLPQACSLKPGIVWTLNSTR